MSPSAPRNPSPWWLKLLLVVLAPVLFLGGLEGALRLGGYGRDTAYFIPEADQPAGTYRSNPRYTELFFPASFGLKPVNFRLTEKKPPNTKRIFLIGESAAMGVPEPGFGLAPQLEAQLRAQPIPAKVEVYNLGITAINSHAILPIVRQAVDFAPDLLVIYMGNNEVVGPYGPGSAITDEMPPLALIRASVALRSTRTGQLLQHLISRLGASVTAFRDWRGMEMFTEKTVPASDPRLQPVYGNFEANLRAMLEIAREADMPVIVSTVAVNLRDSAPFASVNAFAKSSSAGNPEPSAVWQAAYQRGRDRHRFGNADAADVLRDFQIAGQANPGHADTQFQLARQLLHHDESSAATHFRAAREQDALRFRADAQLNQIIRKTAEADANVHLVDNARAMDLAGRRDFFEHVHLTFAGNATLSRNLAAAAHGILHPGSAPFRPLNDARLAEATGFTVAGELTQWQAMDELVTRPPFTNQSTYAEDRTHLLTSMARLNRQFQATGLGPVVKAVADARSRHGHSAFLTFHEAKLTAQQGDHARVLTLLDHYATLAPPSAETEVLRAYALASLQRPNEAIKVLEALTVSDPYYYQTYVLLSALYAGTQQIERGITRFADLVERYPGSRTIQINYIDLLVAAGRIEEANSWRHAVLATVPDDEAALLPLVRQALATNDIDTALDLMRTAHAYNPRNFTNNDRLVQLSQQIGDREGTLRYMRDLIESGPVSEQLYQEYQTLLRQPHPATP